MSLTAFIKRKMSAINMTKRDPALLITLAVDQRRRKSTTKRRRILKKSSE